MNAKILKIFIICFLVMMIFIDHQVLATNNPYLGNPDDYKISRQNQKSDLFRNKAEKILGVVNAVGIVCSVIILCILGIRYMLGSVEDKAEYKRTMIGYVIGALFLFTASTIPNILYQLGTSIGETTQSTPQTPTKPVP